MADLEDVAVAVLPVGVGGDGQATFGAVVQHVAEGGLQRRALAPVLGVPQQRDPLGQGVKYGQEIGPAAVVHHDGHEVVIVLKLRQQPQQLLRGLVGGNDQSGFHRTRLLGKKLHKILS